MTHIGRGFSALLAGMMVTLTAGCISGPRTFSSTQVPATRYVSVEDRPVPVFVFDIPSASQNSDMSFAEDDDCANGQVVSLQQ